MTDLFPAFDTLIVRDTDTTGVYDLHDEIIELFETPRHVRHPSSSRTRI